MSTLKETTSGVESKAKMNTNKKPVQKKRPGTRYLMVQPIFGKFMMYYKLDAMYRTVAFGPLSPELLKTSDILDELAVCQSNELYSGKMPKTGEMMMWGCFIYSDVSKAIDARQRLATQLADSECMVFTPDKMLQHATYKYYLASETNEGGSGNVMFDPDFSDEAHQEKKTSLILDNIPASVIETELQSHFPGAKSLFLARTQESTHLGFGFVEYKSAEQAQKALEAIKKSDHILFAKGKIRKNIYVPDINMTTGKLNPKPETLVRPVLGKNSKNFRVLYEKPHEAFLRHESTWETMFTKGGGEIDKMYFNKLEIMVSYKKMSSARGAMAFFERLGISAIPPTGKLQIEANAAAAKFDARKGASLLVKQGFRVKPLLSTRGASTRGSFRGAASARGTTSPRGLIKTRGIYNGRGAGRSNTYVRPLIETPAPRFTSEFSSSHRDRYQDTARSWDVPQSRVSPERILETYVKPLLPSIAQFVEPLLHSRETRRIESDYNEPISYAPRHEVRPRVRSVDRGVRDAVRDRSPLPSFENKSYHDVPSYENKSYNDVPMTRDTDQWRSRSPRDAWDERDSRPRGYERDRPEIIDTERPLERYPRDIELDNRSRLDIRAYEDRSVDRSPEKWSKTRDRDSDWDTGRIDTGFEDPAGHLASRRGRDLVRDVFDAVVSQGRSGDYDIPVQSVLQPLQDMVRDRSPPRWTSDRQEWDVDAAQLRSFRTLLPEPQLQRSYTRGSQSGDSPRSDFRDPAYSQSLRRAYPSAAVPSLLDMTY